MQGALETRLPPSSLSRSPPAFPPTSRHHTAAQGFLAPPCTLPSPASSQPPCRGREVGLTLWMNNWGMCKRNWGVSRTWVNLPNLQTSAWAPQHSLRPSLCHFYTQKRLDDAPTVPGKRHRKLVSLRARPGSLGSGGWSLILLWEGPPPIDVGDTSLLAEWWPQWLLKVTVSSATVAVLGMTTRPGSQRPPSLLCNAPDRGPRSKSLAPVCMSSFCPAPTAPSPTLTSLTLCPPGRHRGSQSNGESRERLLGQATCIKINGIE